MAGLVGTDWVTLRDASAAEGQRRRWAPSLQVAAASQERAPICSPARRLTSRVAAVGVHEGVGHPLVLLESALLRHAAVDGAQLATLLLPVGHGRLVYCHFFPTVRMQREREIEQERERGQEENRRQEAIRDRRGQRRKKREGGAE